MSKRGTPFDLRGLAYRIRIHDLPADSYGTCDSSDKRDRGTNVDRYIELDCSLLDDPDKLMEILIHECLHGCIWDISEDVVRDTARDIAQVLRALGAEIDTETLSSASEKPIDVTWGVDEDKEQ